MKRIFLLIASILLVGLAAACSSAQDKINIIDGAGIANQSIMVTFNELCSGTVEGFVGTSNNIIISRRKGNSMELYSINTETKDETLIYTSPYLYNYYLNISPDGSKLILENTVIDVNNRYQIDLPEVVTMNSFAYYSKSQLPTYSFSDDGKVILINPFHYINKYYYGIGEPAYQELQKEERPPQNQPGFWRTIPEIGDFKRVRPPSSNYLFNPNVIIGDARFVFIGYKTSNNVRALYMFDFLTKQFYLIDLDVKSYSISPDKRSIAYIKKEGTSKISNVIYVFNMDSYLKTELAELQYISSVSWCGNNEWLVFSGGDGIKDDIWVVRSDGRKREQLTRGMNSSGNLAWSASGNKIAFTSRSSASPAGNKVYIINVNIPPAEPDFRSFKLDENRLTMSSTLLNVIREETKSVMGAYEFY